MPQRHALDRSKGILPHEKAHEHTSKARLSTYEYGNKLPTAPYSVNPFCKRYLLKKMHIYATPQLHRTKKFSQERSLRTRTAAPPECQSDKNKHKKVNFILYLAQLMLSLQLRQTRSAYHYGK